MSLNLENGMQDLLLHKVLPVLNPTEIARLSMTCRAFRGWMDPETKAFALAKRVEKAMMGTMRWKDLNEAVHLLGSRWREFLPEVLETVKALDLRESETDDSRLIQIFSQRYPTIESIDLRGSSISDAGLQAIGKSCPHLKTIFLSSNAVHDEGISFLTNDCPKLETVGIYKCAGVTDAGVERVIDRCESLQRISFRGSCSLSQQSILNLIRKRQWKTFAIQPGRYRPVNRPREVDSFRAVVR